MPSFCHFTVGLILLCIASPATAWWDGGHKAIALIAWERLSPKERKWVMERLDAHPTKSELFEPEMKAELGSEDIADELRQRWSFGQAAVWCDLIRRRDGFPNAPQINAKFHRSGWHYTDLPVFPNDEARAIMKSQDVEPPMHWQPGMAEPAEGFNSMQTLLRVMHELSNKNTPLTDAAVDLCWLFHLVGDTHQPCHCAQLFVPQKMDDGDRGGNRVLVLGFKGVNPGLESDSLHSFWDSLWNGEKNGIEDVARRILPLKKEEVLWSRAEDMAAEPDPRVWLREGHRLAVDAVYSPSLLSRINHVQPVSNPSPGKSELVMMFAMPTAQFNTYVSNARVEARQQIVTAGLRLAAVLRRCITAAEN